MKNSATFKSWTQGWLSHIQRRNPTMMNCHKRNSELAIYQTNLDGTGMTDPDC
jgi:hypothetical protein